MEKRNFKIESNSCIAAGTYRLELTAIEPGYKFSGEFVDIAIPGYYLRRPLSVCDYSEGRLCLVYKVVGEGTEALSKMGQGAVLELLTGLGRGFDENACTASALLVSGGLGAAPLLPLAKRLKAKGRRITAILGFNTAADAVLVNEFEQLCDTVTVTTMDGSLGIKGLVTDAFARTKPEFDYFYTCGPYVMMKAVCNMIPTPGEASLEARMGCGAGFCYGCSCKTLVGAKRICKDGPVFKKEEIIW